MASGFCVNADKVQSALRVSKIFQGVVAAGNGLVIGLSNGVERSVVHTEVPDEVSNVSHVFLVWLWSQNSCCGCRKGNCVCAGYGAMEPNSGGAYVI
jgi:hypothetical protein